MVLEDNNTTYFHNNAKAKNSRNRIDKLKIDVLNWCFDQDCLQKAAKEFYENIFGADDLYMLSYCVRGCFPRLAKYGLKNLNDPVTFEKVKTALFEMSPFKAAGVNRVNVLSFQNQWDTFGQSLFKMVSNAFEFGFFCKELNETMFVPIPKVAAPENLSQFRLISMCNVSYKVITKVLANPMRLVLPKLISESQAKFIP